jgi:hypothetical protein
MPFLQWVIQNEAMKLDPPEIYGWRIFLIATTVSSTALGVWLLLTYLAFRHVLEA